MKPILYAGLVLVLLAGGFAVLRGGGTPAGPDPDPVFQADPGLAPTYEVDAAWPKQLPNNWILGQVSGAAVDSRDHVWIVHRPATITSVEAGAAQDPPISRCCVPAPPVIEFDPEGNVVQAWGGPGSAPNWPTQEHGIFVDHNDNVWIGSDGASGVGHNDNIVLKFTRDGEFLLQIGEFAETGGSNDTRLLGGPAAMTVDPETNEIFIADGYGNRRVIVFDAETGEYRRHWGAYGEPPDDEPTGPYDPDAPPLRQFRTPVHTVRVSHDGLVYVGDRPNNRVQVFQRDGTFVDELILAPETLSMGTVWDMGFSPDPEQTYIYIPDGTNNMAWIVNRHELRPVGTFGGGGRNAGQFGWVHNVAVDSDGNLYTTEVHDHKRVQRFRFVGVGPAQPVQ
jgi:DNA-binding beta-propeller fold protein YncE